MPGVEVWMRHRIAMALAASSSLLKFERDPKMKRKGKRENW